MTHTCRCSMYVDGSTTMMFGSIPQSPYMPCPSCGASVATNEMGRHVCDLERWLDYQMFQLRGEIAAFESELGSYLASPRGRFELWYAGRERLRRAA